MGAPNMNGTKIGLCLHKNIPAVKWVAIFFMKPTLSSLRNIAVMTIELSKEAQILESIKHLSYQDKVDIVKTDYGTDINRKTMYAIEK